MLTPTYCLAKALECEDTAAEQADGAQRDDWLLMADEWRSAATLAAAPPVA